MPLFKPKMAVLDTATLIKVSQDYWGTDAAAREKARVFLAKLTDLGVHISVTLTHVSELVRHPDDRVVRERIDFLHNVKLIAWLRPYNRIWFPGSVFDLLTRELHAVVHESAKGWREIIEKVRPDLWETGVGSDMFVKRSDLWSQIQAESQRQHEHEIYVASVARTNASGISHLTLRELRASARRPKSERRRFMVQFADELRRQLLQHGDRRLRGADQIAARSAQDVLNDMDAIEARGADPLDGVYEYHGVPPELLHPDITVEEIGEIAVYVKQLSIICEKLNPHRAVTIREIQPRTLPSRALEQRLVDIQRKAPRVSGSDLGDSHVAPLVLYADGVEVDKRTHEYLTQIKRSDAELSEFIGLFFKSGDYADVPDHFAEKS
jgi:hypothetical protein